MHIISFIAGVIIGVSIAAALFVFKLVGTLLVTQDADGPYLSLALSKDVNDISNKKYVTMRVRRINTDY